ncbi:hypothetical protein KIPB_002906 [Kipferlia bialata]|uniref:Uncharacterized protein n=1 Tax=Kipferlia bialata TaxID=797122 RepID=A0A9K3CRM9_9EUKA|nr:hypothetical protein KIPB_002906 [Kipferlia bialata]|eukprot:g2906.t1
MYSRRPPSRDTVSGGTRSSGHSPTAKKAPMQALPGVHPRALEAARRGGDVAQVLDGLGLGTQEQGYGDFHSHSVTPPLSALHKSPSTSPSIPITPPSPPSQRNVRFAEPSVPTAGSSRPAETRRDQSRPVVTTRRYSRRPVSQQQRGRVGGGRRPVTAGSKGRGRERGVLHQPEFNLNTHVAVTARSRSGLRAAIQPSVSPVRNMKGKTPVTPPRVRLERELVGELAGAAIARQRIRQGGAERERERERESTARVRVQRERERQRQRLTRPASARPTIGNRGVERERERDIQQRRVTAGASQRDAARMAREVSTRLARAHSHQERQEAEADYARDVGELIGDMAHIRASPTRHTEREREEERERPRERERQRVVPEVVHVHGGRERGRERERHTHTESDRARETVTQPTERERERDTHSLAFVMPDPLSVSQRERERGLSVSVDRVSPPPIWEREREAEGERVSCAQYQRDRAHVERRRVTHRQVQTQAERGRERERVQPVPVEREAEREEVVCPCCRCTRDDTNAYSLGVPCIHTAHSTHSMHMPHPLGYPLVPVDADPRLYGYGYGYPPFPHHMGYPVYPQHMGAGGVRTVQPVVVPVVVQQPMEAGEAGGERERETGASAAVGSALDRDAAIRRLERLRQIDQKCREVHSHMTRVAVGARGLDSHAHVPLSLPQDPKNRGLERERRAPPKGAAPSLSDTPMDLDGERPGSIPQDVNKGLEGESLLGSMCGDPATETVGMQ